MILKSIKYKNGFNNLSVEGYGRTPLNFSKINLIAGQNASGKTQTIDAIVEIAALIANKKKLPILPITDPEIDTKYDIEFIGKNLIYNYVLSFNLDGITEEILTINNVEKFNRNLGRLYYEEAGQLLAFETDDYTLGITKGDKIQQPFFHEINKWAETVSLYRFGSHMGKWDLRDDRNREFESWMSDTNNSIIANIFIAGKKIESNFPVIVKDDMKQIGYDNIIKIDEITLGVSKDNEQQIDHSMHSLYVKEAGARRITSQLFMSQGMFRALSLIIQLNYSLLSNQPSLILIDDIGEGLDYERSKKLIDLIIKKIEGTQVQLIMTTNDRFVMNKVPLKYWQVIKREKNKSVFYNYENSKQTFDDFALTGLSNFDFFATEFFVKGFDEYVKVNP